jgi:large subunit ribosomal protein L22
MDLDRLRIISCYYGTKLERFIPRAMGRSSPKIDTLAYEIVAQKGIRWNNSNEKKDNER